MARSCKTLVIDKCLTKLPELVPLRLRLHEESAVMAAGISGLTPASLPGRRHRVDLFEQERRPGGHTSTVLVDGPDGR